MGREKERRGKGKVEGMTEERGGRKACGIRMGGIAPLLLAGIDATVSCSYKMQYSTSQDCFLL